jgi:topoisomerase IV subunit A
LVHLNEKESPDKMIDALYAFTDCEVSIAPNACVIEDDKPKFIGVSDMLWQSTEETKGLLKLELEIEKRELEEKWHFASLEKIFIENRIYRDIEECETWEEILAAIHKGLKPHTQHLLRAVTDEDVTRLTEIRIKRISKFDTYKADEYLSKLEEDITQVKHHLDNLTDFAIEYFKNLKKKYAQGRERKTEIRSLDVIERSMVAASNVKLYVDRAEGFVGYGLKRTEAEFVCDASDIDDIIIIRSDGVMMVTKMADKTFVGKDILLVDIWKKDDERTIYNMIYQDGPAGSVYVKRFNVTSIVRDREYDLTKGTAKSKVLHLTANLNGEAEVVTVLHRAKAKIKKIKFEFDFSEQAIKGRAANGNILTKHAVNRIELKEKGVSTLSARKVWFDDAVKRLNYEERGTYLGAFNGEDRILIVMASGNYRLTGIDLLTRFDEDMILIEKWNPNKPVSAIYFDGEKEDHFVKRFLVESHDKPTLFISESDQSKLEFVSLQWRPQALVKFDQRSSAKEDEIIDLESFISLKGLKAQGNKLSRYKVKTIEELDPLPYIEEEPTHEEIAVEAMDESEENDSDLTTETEEEVSIPKATLPPIAKKVKPEVVKEEPEEPEEPEQTTELEEEEETPEVEPESLAPNEKSEKPEVEEEQKPQEDKPDKPKGEGFGAGSQITLEL